MATYQIPQSASEERIPLYFRIAQLWRFLLRGKKGEFFLYEKLLNAGFLNRVCKFKHFEEGIYIPLASTFTDMVNDYSYHLADRELNFSKIINDNLDDFMLIDCGAAFGQHSMKIASLCPKIKSIIAIDPNHSHCEILEKNLSLKKIDFKIHHAAVSDFSGNAELIFPNGEHDTHSAYIVKSDTGTINVVRLDDIVDSKGMDIAIKIDVEGQEIPAIMGAKNIIEKARVVCFFVEIHPKVLQRNHQNGEDILKAISNIRPTKWCIADDLDYIIDENKPFFSQVDEIRQYDVIGLSISP